MRDNNRDRVLPISGDSVEPNNVLALLFRHVRPGARKGKAYYTNVELARFVAEETGRTCTKQYISMLRKDGNLDGLTHAKIAAIAKFFRVPAGLFFGEEASVEDVLNQAQLRTELTTGSLDVATLRHVLQAASASGGSGNGTSRLRAIADDLLAQADELDERQSAAGEPSDQPLGRPRKR